LHEEVSEVRHYCAQFHVHDILYDSDQDNSYYYYHMGSSVRQNIKESRRQLPEAAILEMIRRPEDSAEATLRDWIRQASGHGETVMVPTKKFQLSDYGRRWEQTWCLPSNNRSVTSVGSEEITKWLSSLSAKDIIILRPTQDFFAHDVALYGGFGLKIYCAWI